MKFKSFKEYILFLYVHLAYADGEVHDSERELILKRMKYLFPGETQPEQVLDNMIQAYIKESGQSQQIIEAAHQQFNNVEFYKKYKVFKDLFDIIHADGVVAETEQEALNKLKTLIGIEIEH